MRIVGGKHRSRVLKEFKDIGIRPTSDRTRESLFNILSTRLDGATFLDLFAGTGAVGLEALSRGAKSVTFVDNSIDSLLVVKENLATLKETADVKRADSLEFLRTTNKRFDIIFIDPPYKSNLGKSALEIIAKRKILTDDGIAVFEDEGEFHDTVGGLFRYDERKYGRARLSFFKNKKESAVFAGTFDPITLGHYDMVKRATDEFEKVFVVLMVNPNKTPFFSKEERLSFMQTAFKNLDSVIVDSHDGYAVDYLKKVGTPYYVRGIRSDVDFIYEKKNEELSRTIYPELQTVYYKAPKTDRLVSSTAVRTAIEQGQDYKKLLPEGVYDKVVKVLKERK